MCVSSGAAMRVGPMRGGASVGGRGAGPMRRECCAGCAQYGGVVHMGDGAVTFKGVNISNTKAAVRGSPSRFHVACRVSHILMLCAAWCHMHACHGVWARGARDTLDASH